MKYFLIALAFVVGFIVGQKTYKPQVITKTETELVPYGGKDLNQFCHKSFDAETEYQRGYNEGLKKK